MRQRVHAVRTWTTRPVQATIVLTFLVTCVGPAAALAQQPTAAAAPPETGWSGNISAGLALTSGNADTSNFNVAIKATYDPVNRHSASIDALYLQGSNDGETNVSRTSVNMRDDYALSARASLFGQFRYLRDTFKGIDYLAAPTMGVGYKLANSARTKINVDAGAGVAWERDSTRGLVTTDGAITAGENVTHNLTATTVITHGATALWKTADFADALYTVGVGLSAALTSRTQLKLELLELYKTQPPIGLLSQDVSFITSVVYSF